MPGYSFYLWNIFLVVIRMNFEALCLEEKRPRELLTEKKGRQYKDDWAVSHFKNGKSENKMATEGRGG